MTFKFIDDETAEYLDDDKTTLMVGLIDDIELRQIMAKERDDAGAIVEDCNGRIKARMAALGTNACTTKDWEAKLIPSDRTSLNKEKLLQYGVSMATIQKATEVTQVIQLRVGPRKPEK